MSNPTAFLILAGGVAVGETIAGLYLSIVAGWLNRRNEDRGSDLIRRSFADLHKKERKGK